MDRTDEQNAEITLDLSKLLGFDGLDLPAGETDLRQAIDSVHNKVGEIEPPSPDRNI